MREVVKRWIDIREGEKAQTTLMFFSLFLIIAIDVIFKSVRDSLFLSHFSALKLPYVYIGIALSTAPLVWLYTKFSGASERQKILRLTLLFFGLSAISFRWALEQKWGWLYPVLYIWVGLYGAVVPAQFWLLSNDLFNSRQAKRLFSWIISGGILGGIVGGIFTRKAAYTLGTENLMLCCAAAVALLSLLFPKAAKGISVFHPNSDVSLTSSVDNASVDNVDKSPSTHTLWRSAYSKYLKYLALLAALSVIVATLVDFQFKTIAERSFSSSDALTSFFGSFYALTGLVALLVQLLFSQGIWRRMGIGASLLLMPFSIAIGALALLIYPSLWSVIIMKGGEGSFKHSLNRSGMELLFLPVPSDLKGRAKSLIDMSIDRLARGFAGVLLLFLTSLLALKIQHLNLLILGLSAIWLWFIFLSKREYVNFLRHTLAESAESNETAAERFGAIPTCPHLCDNDNRLRLMILEEAETYSQIARRKSDPTPLEPLGHEHLARIFQMLSCQYPKEDMKMAFAGLSSPRGEQRANALEFLDNTLERHLKLTLIPLFEGPNQTSPWRELNRRESDRSDRSDRDQKPAYAKLRFQFHPRKIACRLFCVTFFITFIAQGSLAEMTVMKMAENAEAPIVKTQDQDQDNDNDSDTSDTSTYRTLRTLSASVSIWRQIPTLPQKAWYLTTYPLKPALIFAERVDLAERTLDVFTNDSRTAGIIPTVSLGSTTGSGIGAMIFHNDLFKSRHKLHSEIIFSGIDNVYFSANYLVPRWRYDRISYQIDIGYLRDDDEKFFFGGIKSRETEATHYAQVRRVANVEVGYLLLPIPSRSLKLTVDFGYSRTEASPASIEEIKGELGTLIPSSTDGLGEATLLTSGIKLTYDTRNHRAYTSAGGLIQVGGDLFTGDRFKFYKTSLEMRQFLRLFLPERILAIRGRLEGINPIGKRPVPFYEMRALGDSETLRGFERGRFRDRNSLLFNVEYRYPIWDTWNAALFLDAGQVFAHISEVAWDELKYDYGLGVHFRTSKAFLFRLELARSEDDFRAIFRLQPTI